MIMNENIRVAVCLVTYNQEKYIRQAVESALNQRTDFPVDIFVGNDCSTDRTQQVLEQLESEIFTHTHTRAAFGSA